jgi:hypothetical protein
MSKPRAKVKVKAAAEAGGPASADASPPALAPSPLPSPDGPAATPTFPNKATQFAAGNCANPKGRPRGKSITSILRRIGDLAIADAEARRHLSLSTILDQLGPEVASGEPLTASELAALRLWAIALYEFDPKHAIKALGLILDRVEGRAKQTVDVAVKELPPVDLTKLSKHDLLRLRGLARKVAEGRPGGGDEGV